MRGGDPRRRQILVVRRETKQQKPARKHQATDGRVEAGQVIAKGEQPSTADESFVLIWGCSRDGLADQVQGPGLSRWAGERDGIVLPFCARESRA